MKVVVSMEGGGKISLVSIASLLPSTATPRRNMIFRTFDPSNTVCHGPALKKHAYEIKSALESNKTNRKPIRPASGKPGDQRAQEQRLAITRREANQKAGLRRTYKKRSSVQKPFQLTISFKHRSEATKRDL